MERHHVLTIAAVAHPDPRVDRLGFELDAPYVERCWVALVGPSATLFLRRLPSLWSAGEPARIAESELASSLGLGMGPGSRSRLVRSMDRCARFGLATWTEEGTSLAVYRRTPPLRPHQLARLPEWTQQAHHELLGEHLEASQRTRPGVESMTRRLDRLQRPTGTDVVQPISRTKDVDE